MDDRKLIAAHCIFLGNDLIHGPKKYRVVACSSTESEYRSLAHTNVQINWIQALLSETPIVWCDNISALSLAANSVFHSPNKHVELDVHVFRDKVPKQLDVRYVPFVY